jgi:hypothetical protein
MMNEQIATFASHKTYEKEMSIADEKVNYYFILNIHHHPLHVL